MTFDQFLEQCTSCGGNLSAMLMTGIKVVAPDVYEQMPQRSYDLASCPLLSVIYVMIVRIFGTV